MIIETYNLTVKYGKLVALDHVDLEGGEGTIGILGPNGAGKTTLIRTLLGFQDASEGSAKVLDHNIVTEQMDIRRKVGYMPELECYIPGMTGIAQVAYMGQLTGMTRSDAIQRAHEILFYVGLGEQRYRSVETYSTGMKQRVKLAGALVHDPTLLLLDEPTNGMDPEGREEMLALIHDLAYKRSINILFCSHLLQDVEQVCKDIILLNEGKIEVSGDLKALKKEAANIFTLKVKGDIVPFVEALKLKHCKVDMGRNFLRIELPENTPLFRIFEIAAQRKIQIRHLSPSERSLEDIFLAAVRGGTGNNNANI